MQSHLQMGYHFTFLQSKHMSLYLVKNSFLLRGDMRSNVGFNSVICKDDTVPGIVIVFTLVVSIRTLHNCVSKQAREGKQENIMSIIIEVDSNSGSKLQLLCSSKTFDYIGILQRQFISSRNLLLILKIGSQLYLIHNDE